MFSDLIKAQIMQQMLAQQQNPQGMPGQGAEPLMQQLAQGEQAIQENSEGNPIARGSSIGLEAAKRSLEMSPREERRALGRALINFGSSFAANAPEPGTGFAGALGAMNKSFLPGLNAYDAERGRTEASNFAIMKMLEEQARHAREEEFRQQQLQEQARYHDMMAPVNAAHAEHYKASTRRLEKENKKLENAELKKEELIGQGLIPEGSLMLDEIQDRGEREVRIQESKEWQKKLAPAVKSLKNLDKLEEIYKRNLKNKNPLWKKSSRAFEALLRGDEKGYKQFLQGLTNEKDKADLDLINKIANDYVLEQSKIFPGRATDVTKRIMIGSFVNASTHPKAVAEIIKKMRENDLWVAKNARLYSNAWKHRAVPMQDTQSLEDYLENPPETSIEEEEDLTPAQNKNKSPELAQTSQASPVAKEINARFSKEEIAAALAKKRAQIGMNP